MKKHNVDKSKTQEDLRNKIVAQPGRQPSSDLRGWHGEPEAHAEAARKRKSGKWKSRPVSK